MAFHLEKDFRQFGDIISGLSHSNIYKIALKSDLDVDPSITLIFKRDT